MDYLFFILAIIVCAFIAGIASQKVHKTFTYYDRGRCSSGYSGYDVAWKLMRSRGVDDISISLTKGFLTDNYHPTKKRVNLSESTYSNNSVAAVAVAAHEIGHVMQNKEGYGFYKLRTALVPVVNFGSFMAMPLVIIGIILDVLFLTTDSSVGFYVALVGVALYGLSLLFALVTLPVELNASKRAKQMLLSDGIISASEADGVEKVLSAAAFTYLASLLTSLVYFLRFLFMVLSIFGKRNRR